MMSDSLSNSIRAFIAALAYAKIDYRAQREVIDRWLALIDAPAGSRELALRLLKEHRDAGEHVDHKRRLT